MTFCLQGNCQTGLKGEKGERGVPGMPAPQSESVLHNLSNQIKSKDISTPNVSENNKK